ncbi:MAG: hypothetical protein AAFR98_13480, partial [Pseudomonadota bacterium]
MSATDTEILSLITLHHLSSTGGTVITKLLSTSDQLAVISEKSPFYNGAGKLQSFLPQVCLPALTNRYNRDVASAQLRDEVRGAAARTFAQQLTEGARLSKMIERIFLIRDWSHGDFLQRPFDVPRAGLIEVLDF